MTRTLTRREFTLAAAAATAAGSILAAPARAFGRLRRQGAGLEVQELARGVWAVLGGGGNALIIRTEGAGGIVIDTKLPQSSGALFEAAAARRRQLPLP
jgi:hypothetical protein